MTRPHMLKRMELSNVLSFGPDPVSLDLMPLNVFIGPNGSGKSNVLEVLSLLRAAPRELLGPIRDGGGVRDWLWKGGPTAPVARIDVIVDPGNRPRLRHRLAFSEIGQRFAVFDESIEDGEPTVGPGKPLSYLEFEDDANLLVRMADTSRRLPLDKFNSQKSILAQLRDPVTLPELTRLAEAYEDIRIYRDWSFGRYTPPRLPQKADAPNDHLAEDCSNLALVLNGIRRNLAHKQALLADLRLLYDGIEDYEVSIEGGTVQLFLIEGTRLIPATRLSDGTLRFLCLLALLHHPNPPPLLAIEEPELGLHPDVLPRLAELLVEASARTQLFVTTHSDRIVDKLSAHPEYVVITEKRDGSTHFTRLDPTDLAVWLEKYSLGELWTRGDIGGTRW